LIFFNRKKLLPRNLGPKPDCPGLVLLDGGGRQDRGETGDRVGDGRGRRRLRDLDDRNGRGRRLRLFDERAGEAADAAVFLLQSPTD